MPPKGVKRTNTSNRSIQNESGNQETKKPSRKKSKQKNKTDSQSNNKGEKGENTGDNISVNKQFKTPISEQSRYGGVNANVNMSQPNFSHDASLFIHKFQVLILCSRHKTNSYAQARIPECTHHPCRMYHPLLNIQLYNYDQFGLMNFFREWIKWIQN
ncbi:unnamed protein product [Mytilus edulis]|uniref:Uncharacterized protein n=1 Tax=Mytilus edulis TaxID=6550 RepID=A0A8S3UL24_MYTED|nr:unnamed protein product [Mytilus edulis]